MFFFLVILNENISHTKTLLMQEYNYALLVNCCHFAIIAYITRFLA